MTVAEQQINLYQQPEGKGNTAAFSSGTAVKLAGAVALGLLAVWGYGLWRVQRLEQAVTSLRQQQQRQQDTMTALNAARDLGTSPEQIDARVKELSEQVEARTRALAMLRDGVVGGTDGFSRRLVALAQHPVEGLWLDHVLLSGITPSMGLGGVAMSADLIPAYLRGLSAEGALAGVRFGELVIERPAAKTSSQEQPLERSAPRGFQFRAQGLPVAQTVKDPTP
jgi:hypothetical protein